MHPDLYFVVHQQRERELDERLRRRLVAEERATPRTAGARRPRLTRLVSWVQSARPAPRPAPVCCPA
ncbi:hypothetical protein ASD16_13370 [Cellulomonas sp. Root485]|uniref:hypothetical protein n=1 Tax=Cellulomonas sp. Root485 TaxID=1736546 RepID=UPI0006FB2C7D|nr:hypothetical protein [Cellulomonas sp. Root485]KQY23504.1 hypothetical protein ASD16_13370 [Cellulomonas sp. Root485]